MLDLQTNVLKKRISEQAAFANIFILEGEKGDFYQPILSVHGLSLPRWDILGTPLNWQGCAFLLLTYSELLKNENKNL